MTPERREAHRERRRRYRQSENGRASSQRHDAKPERRRRKRRQREIRQQQERAVVIALLGGHCGRCGGAERLEIDHVHGDGYIERRKLFVRKRTARYYHLVLRSVRADEGRYQVLCRSCNLAKARTEDRARRAEGSVAR